MEHLFGKKNKKLSWFDGSLSQYKTQSQKNKDSREFSLHLDMSETCIKGKLAKKKKTQFVFGRLFPFDAVLHLLLLESLLIPLIWWVICKKLGFVGWATEMSLWVVSIKNLANLLLQCQTSFCCCCWLLIWASGTPRC